MRLRGATGCGGVVMSAMRSLSSALAWAPGLRAGDVERRHGLLPGDRQVPVTRGAARQYLDVRYSDYGVIVELDGVLAHSPQNSKQDARRDNAATRRSRPSLRLEFVAYYASETAQQVFELLRRNGYRRAPLREELQNSLSAWRPAPCGLAPAVAALAA